MTTKLFRSIQCTDYKNFLRLHLTDESLTIYPIGIRHVTKDWTNVSSEGEHPRFRGAAVKVHLIEAPIVIYHQMPALASEVAVKEGSVKS